MRDRSQSRQAKPLIFIPDNHRGDGMVIIGRDGYQDGQIRITTVVEVNGRAVADLTDAIRPDELSMPELKVQPPPQATVVEDSSLHDFE